MNVTRTLLFRALLPVALIGSYVYLTYGKERPSVVHIVRKAAWNDFLVQIKVLLDDSQQGLPDKEMPVIHRFLKAHDTEASVGIYDLAVLESH